MRAIHVLIFSGWLAMVAVGSVRADLGQLKIFSPDQPVSFFFRDTEATAARHTLTYEEWSARYSRLAGVMGKMLDEEVLGRSAAQPYYRRFKVEHPDQAVLLHANGDFRNPLADNRAYHAGHWLYYNGARVLDAVAGSGDEITVRVSDVTPFNLTPYRVNPKLPDDVGLCGLTVDGKPDWNRAEQTRLIAIDAKQGTITLKRGLYGSARQTFAAGQAYVAAHVAQTWGTTNKLWQFNLSTTCPRDAEGRGAADIWSSELITSMKPGGALDYLDGLEFDVPFIRPVTLGRNRQADCDADGRADDGVVAGKPVYALGVDQFYRTLRAALPDRLIMADVGERAQRSTATLNGVETEGWPHLRDTNFEFWSAGLNEQAFWHARARAPIFTYGLLKFRDGGSAQTESEVPLSSVRLALAGPVLVGSAVPIGYATPAGANGVWDELVGGTLGKAGWLGRAVAPVRHLALESPDLLRAENLVKRLSSNDAVIRAGANGGITARARDAKAAQFTVRLAGLSHQAAGDLVVSLTATAEHMPDYGSDFYRLLAVDIVPTGGTSRRGRSDPAPTSPVAGEAFQSFFYQRNVPAGDVDVVIVAEGAQAIGIEAMAIHAASDCMVREFEHGVILANPSFAPRAFVLATLFPGKSFHRLTATAAQDAKTNDGSRVAGVVTLPPKDALFLIKD